MKINRFGQVIIEKETIRVEGWLIEREPADPLDATEEQLLLGFATEWALARMKAELLNAKFDVFRQLARTKLTEIGPHTAGPAKKNGLN